MTNSNASERMEVLIAGEWRPADAAETFAAINPATGSPLAGRFPVSRWGDLDRALDAASAAIEQMRHVPRSAIAGFLRRYADLIDLRADAIVAMAAAETGLPLEPRLKLVELPRTTAQLRQAADAASDDAWRLPTIDRTNDLRSVLESLGPVLVLGPNNFPLAFNGISGGDFAAAIAAGNPVIAKAHPLQPHTSRLLAIAARDAIEQELPASIVQMIFGVTDRDGLRLVGDPRLGAVAFTGSRARGMAIKEVADRVGKPVYVEMSSINPVVILPGALAERPSEIVAETAASGLMGAGQFCTNPGLIVTIAAAVTESFIAQLAAQYATRPVGTLLSESVLKGLASGVALLSRAGARVIQGGAPREGNGFAFDNTLLRVEGATYLSQPHSFQTEVFGNCTLIVVAADVEQAEQVLATCEGSLTGCIYSARDGSEDGSYDRLVRVLGPRVGRILNDKMPTGVTVSPAMNHGGPFPATGHPHFTAVGIPASLRRFTRLVCYDHVRPHRLPSILRDDG